MRKIIECVPNFSEGNDEQVITAIAEAISSQKDVYLLNVDPGKAANRTVMTFAGPPEAVTDAAFAAIKAASEHIDLSKHKGVHPRMGATDVCPFIPVQNIGMKETTQYAGKLAQRIGDKLHIPVYLYEHSASNPERSNLADIRKGGFEGLETKMTQLRWTPDYGPSTPHPTAGAIAIGARKFLVAYNINLNTKDVSVARKIAEIIRESGFFSTKDAQKKQKPGKLKAVKAIGWYIEEYGCAQVSMNLVDFHKTSIAEVFETVKEEAERAGVTVNGSELIGMVPFDALKQSAEFYAPSESLDNVEIIAFLTQKFGLNAVKRFEPDERILEYKLHKAAPHLIRKPSTLT